MTTESSNANEKLTAAVKETLRRTGALDDVRAQLRSTIFRCMNESLPPAATDRHSDSTHSTSIPGPLPIENVLTNEMIAEYLSFNGYEHTLSVFAAETSSGQSPRAASTTTGGGNGGGVGVLGEAFIRAELGLNRCGSYARSSDTLPILYEVVESMKARKRNIMSRE